MDNKNQEFDLSILQSEDISTFEKIHILSLYDNYANTKISSSNDITLIKLQGAYNKITEKFENNLDIIDNEYFNFIWNKYLVLKDYKDSLDIKNKNSLVNMVNIITNLECLLKLPITFPVSLELCLEEELNNLKKKAGENHGRVAK